MGITSSSQNVHLEKYLGNDFPLKDVLIGFENPSNICYSNVIIQALYYCDEFREHVLKSSNTGENLIQLTKMLFSAIVNHKHRTGVISTKKMMNFVKSKNKIFDGKYHQDCHEFYMWFVNECEEIIKKQGQQSQANWLQTIFQGHLITQTKCLNCGTQTERDETYYNLSLDIEANCSLSNCIGRLSQEEQLKGSNQFYCDKCLSKQDAVKRQVLGALPKTLVIHLKRFKYDDRYNAMMKMSQKIPFANQLKVKEQLYELKTIIVHLGQGILYGHYLCLIRIAGKWFKFDDERISIFADQDMHLVFGRNYQISQQTAAYMLFYDMI